MDNPITFPRPWSNSYFSRLHFSQRPIPTKYSFIPHSTRYPTTLSERLAGKQHISGHLAGATHFQPDHRTATGLSSSSSSWVDTTECYYGILPVLRKCRSAAITLVSLKLNPELILCSKIAPRRVQKMITFLTPPKPVLSPPGCATEDVTMNKQLPNNHTQILSGIFDNPDCWKTDNLHPPERSASRTLERENA